MTSVADNRHLREKTGPGASFFFVALLFSVFVLGGCGEADPPAFSYSGRIMGTTYNVKVVAPDAAVAENLGNQVFAVLDDVDRKMSTYKPDSELNRLNAAPVGEPFAVSPELMAVLVLSEKVYEETGGAFDPTVGPLVNLWGFGPDYREGSVPASAEVQALLGEVGMDALEIAPEKLQVTKTRPLFLDLSAVAKGYAADLVGELLQRQGLSSYMVEVGGEMKLAGRNERDVPWQIAIEKPDAASRAVQLIVGIEQGGVATSGDYRNYFEKDGVRYSHTIDPRRGYPIDHGLASVTVITDNSALSDALATAFLVMGAEQTLAFAEREDIAVYTLSKKGDGFESAHSSAFATYLNEVQ